MSSVSHVFEVTRLLLEQGVPFQDRTTREALMQAMGRLLSHMVDALRWSLLNSDSDCGGEVPLPWVTDILQCYEIIESKRMTWGFSPDFELAEHKATRPAFLLVLCLLQVFFDRGFITTDTYDQVFALDRLLFILGHPELPPLPADLTHYAIGVAKRDASATRQMQDVPKVRLCSVYMMSEANRVRRRLLAR